MESPINPWAKVHDDPVPPEETFRQYYERHIKPGPDGTAPEKTDDTSTTDDNSKK